MIYEFMIVGGTVIVYQFVQYVIHQHKTPKEPQPRDDAVNIEIGDYLPQTYDSKTLEIPHKAKIAVDEAITDTSLLYPISEAAIRLAKSDTKSDFEFGWGWDKKHILHIHCNTIFPNATPEMMRFWFINHGNGRGKYHWYKWWHPMDHYRVWWSDEQINPTKDDKNGYIGHTSYVYEYLCKDIANTEMDHLRIHFVDPKEYGFTENMMESNEREIVCAKVGFMQYQVDTAKFIHYFEKYGDNGCIMKSRFWVGEAVIDDTVPIPLRWIIGFLFSFKFMRKIMIANDTGKRILTHCAKEMNNLSSFLPQLYNLFHK